MTVNEQLAEALQIGEDFANECISAHIAAYGETWPSQNRKLESLREDLRKIQAARAALDSELAQRLAQDAALDAAVAAEQAAHAVPAGWKLVPVEPTPEMLDAGNAACDGGLYAQDFVHGPRAMQADRWAAMLAAAPAAPAPAPEASA